MKTRLLSVIIGLMLSAGLVAQQPADPLEALATIRLDNVKGCPGEIVEIPVTVLGNMSQHCLTTFDLFFHISDTSVIEPVLTTWDSVKKMGIPLLTGFDSEFEGKGSFMSNYYWGAPNRGSYSSTLVLSYYYYPPFERSPRPASGFTLINLNFRIKKPFTEPVEIILGNNSGLSGCDLKPYRFSFDNTSGFITPKSAPKVTIADKGKGIDSADWGLFSDTPPDRIMCAGMSLQLDVSGAQRYEWSYYRPAKYWNYSNIDGLWTLEELLDNTTVSNPVFTPKEEPRPMYRIYGFKVKGYNSDGCYSEDSVVVAKPWMLPVDPQQDYYMLREGSTITMKMLYTELPFGEPQAHEFEVKMPYVYSWYPYDKVENPTDSITETKPITEPTWFVGQIQEQDGCVRTFNVWVDVYNDSLFGKIEHKAKAFCGDENTENNDTLAALIYGGSADKEYIWEARNLYSGKEPVISQISTSAINLKFWGNTEVKVTIRDLETGNELVLVDTLRIQEIKPLSVQIKMDEETQTQAELGFCVDMPLTFLATTENAGKNAKVYWELGGYRIVDAGGWYRYGDTLTTTLNPGSNVRAVVYSDEYCLDKPYAFSNAIDPKVEFYQITGIFIQDSSARMGADRPTCNSDSAILHIHAHNLGTGPLFEIYRNGEYLHTYEYEGESADFAYPVKSYNYWDRFQVRFINTSCYCLPEIYNKELSNYIMPQLATTNERTPLKIVSDMGGDTVCDDNTKTYTLRLDSINQFAKNTTVIWMLNDKEWGRYEFDPAVSAGLAVQPERHNESLFVINLNKEDEEAIFHESYPFYLNKKNFPTLADEDSIWAIVISRTTSDCGLNSQFVIDTVKPLKPRMMPMQDAVLTLSSVDKNGIITLCEGSELTIDAKIEGAGRAILEWQWKGKKADVGAMSYTLKNAKAGDSLMTIVTSNYQCAPNLPDTTVSIIKINPRPNLSVSNDTTICLGEDVQLLATINSQALG
ncbi:MAG: hypothetical protein LBU91_04020, partial [Bacteroidales bacterium]|nr:hypothetical protein [Bacteroidales bacterium]